MSFPLEDIKGVGPARVKQFEKLSVFTGLDLICHYPRTYEDRRNVVPIGASVVGAMSSIRAVVATMPSHVRLRKGMELVRFRVEDETGGMDVTYFNQPWRKNSIKKGEQYVFFGKVEGDLIKRSMANPEVAKPDSPEATAIMPIYKLTAGLSQNVMRNFVSSALSLYADKVADILPEDIKTLYSLMPIGDAYEAVHRPHDTEDLFEARRRLAFEELFLLSLGLSMLGRRVREEVGRPILPCDMSPFFSSLPFELTGAQQRVIASAMDDMSGKVPMNRLVQGDVGSGKTAVAAALCYNAAMGGAQSAMMSPTEILAEQHYRTLSAMLSPLGVEVVLLTGSMKVAEKRAATAKIEAGAAVAVGTHALISGGVKFKNLALVITDEQHRFGVSQRAALSEKGESPHTLVMSATPIPRTLALMIYGDLDVSALDEMPKGRQQIDTFVVGEDMRERINSFMVKQISEGRQVFVVCPLIETEEEDGRHDVLSHTDYLKKSIAPYRVEALHGKMKASEKEALMSQFASGEIDCLVSTTVVEVGVDVPNASLMVVENAERFGLSQLHQLRGRVGRGRHKSYCVLFKGGGGEQTAERLAVMSTTNDGFEIARRDLELRGPGDFFGERQHGLPALAVADLAADSATIEVANKAAAELLNRDPQLNGYPLLRERIEEMFSERQTSLN